jgi:hypothetical protein
VSTTVIHAGGVISPSAMRGWDARADARSIVHTVLGRTDPDITARPTGLRKGTLTLVFTTGAEAYAARAVLAVTQPLTLSNSEIAEVAMSFVVAGGELGDVLGAAGDWTIEVPFQEVLS